MKRKGIHLARQMLATLFTKAGHESHRSTVQETREKTELANGQHSVTVQ
jgi:hypothetical protein